MNDCTNEHMYKHTNEHTNEHTNKHTITCLKIPAYECEDERRPYYHAYHCVYIHHENDEEYVRFGFTEELDNSVISEQIFDPDCNVNPNFYKLFF